ncbi:antitermination protein Q [Atlantibacter hermannii]|uniref:antitermination protein Q n=1 Tax=Atlantibacter hermannii TaxID=565 RepID=UPI0028A622F8|nr:antitermination protein [Atlantibacter hermannii]
MRLEAIGKYFAPKSPHITDSPRATKCDSLSISEVMAALGLAGLKSGIGLDLYLAKIGISSPDKAVEGVYEIAKRLAGQCTAISELDEDVKQRVLQLLATFAYQDYSRSAASVRKCDCCNGEGFLEADVFSMKTSTPKHAREVIKMSRECGLKITPSSYEARRGIVEVTRVLCPKCKGKRVISNSCRCHGKGKVVDEEATKAMGGIPVWKECDKCTGRGYSRLKFSTVLDAVRTAWDVKKTTGYDHLQPFFEALVTECHKEESVADSMLAKVTN